jgi:hypothetical protein
VVRVDDGWAVAWSRSAGGWCDELLLVRLSEDGEVLAGPEIVAGGSADPARRTEPSLVWTGRELALAWTEQSASDEGVCEDLSGARRWVLQRFDLELDRVGDPVTFVGCDTFFNSVYDVRIGWNGHVYGVAWSESRQDEDQLRYATVDRDGEVVPSCGAELIASENDRPRPATGPVWNGTEFGVLWEECPPGVDCNALVFADLYLRRASAGAAPGPVGDPLRITTDPGRSWQADMTWTGAAWQLAWSDEQDGGATFPEIYTARVSAEGELLDPPGLARVTFGNADQSGTAREHPALAWTGAEFGLVYNEDWGSLVRRFRAHFERMEVDGTTPEPPDIWGGGAAGEVDRPDLAWSGREFGLVARESLEDDPERASFRRIGCDCRDADGDGFSNCAGGDCDDGDPTVNPLQAEDCVDGQDDNCDGFVDCQDAARCPAGEGDPPPAASGLVFDDRTTIVWDPLPSADVYDVLTGSVGQLAVDGGFDGAECLAWRLPEPRVEVSAVPVPGSGTYYLARGKIDRCLLGTWGSTLRDEARLTCP